MAVGSTLDAYGQPQALAEVRRSTSWTFTSVAVRHASGASQLTGVSCTSADDCMAVGRYAKAVGGPTTTLIEKWNGSIWTQLSSPSPGSSDNSLAGVSCVAANACTAVGSTTSSGALHTLAMTWNGTAWATISSANPGGSNGSSLLGVDCITATACVAVGSFETRAHVSHTLTEIRRAAGFAKVVSADPANSSQLSAVTCTASQSCTAVGSYGSGSSQNTLVEVWNGVSWAQVASANPNPFLGNQLNAVACVSSASCVAVGASPAAGGGAISPVLLVEVWDGVSWKAVTVTDPSAGYGSQLAGVACISSGACTAVGFYAASSGRHFTLVEAPSGTSWAKVFSPTPLGPANGSLSGITCLSATACTAVGGYQTESGATVRLVDTWNGVQWTSTALANPQGVIGSTFNSVSCAASNFCVATGMMFSNSGIAALLDMWDGATWTQASFPNPGVFGSALNSVSCATPTSCTAVGSYRDGSGAQFPLIEMWDGSSWTEAASPQPPTGGYPSEFDGVSCSAGNACTAVGYYDDRSGTSTMLIEVWDGSIWSLVSGMGPGVLRSVSCLTADACIAAGSSYGVLVLESGSGNVWTQISGPKTPAGTYGAGLTGISCTAITRCTAVGGYAYNSTSVGIPLASTWNGANWTANNILNPGGSNSTFLSGVGCTASNCTTVGNVGFPVQQTAPLIETSAT